MKKLTVNKLCENAVVTRYTKAIARLQVYSKSHPHSYCSLETAETERNVYCRVFTAAVKDNRTTMDTNTTRLCSL